MLYILISIGPRHYNLFVDASRQSKYGVKHATDAGDYIGIVYTPLPRFY